MLILPIGVAIVIGMILCLRINAFIALITAAVVVALLAEGDTAANVAGVGGAFGKVCGGIGIVIALAAVIGKCLMDSGAADRIVRSFMSLLGQKRASGIDGQRVCAVAARVFRYRLLLAGALGPIDGPGRDASVGTRVANDRRIAAER
jgi:Mg2+/citrate symporter